MFQRNLLTTSRADACDADLGAPRRRIATTVEYALFLTLLVGAVFCAAVFVKLSAHTGGVHTVAQWQLFVAGIGLAIGALVWRRLYCRNHGDRATILAPTDYFDGEGQALLFEKRQEVLRILAGDWQMLLDSRLQVRHLMTHRVMAIAPGAPVAEASRIMKQQGVRHVMVRDREGALVGVISDRDLLRPGATAEKIMTPEPITVASDAPIAPAITLMFTKHFSCLPVVDGQTLVGVLTTTDLVMALQCTLQTLSRIAYHLRDGGFDRYAENDEQAELVGA